MIAVTQLRSTYKILYSLSKMNSFVNKISWITETVFNFSYCKKKINLKFLWLFKSTGYACSSYEMVYVVLLLSFAFCMAP